MEPPLRRCYVGVSGGPFGKETGGVHPFPDIRSKMGLGGMDQRDLLSWINGIGPHTVDISDRSLKFAADVCSAACYLPESPSRTATSRVERVSSSSSLADHEDETILMISAAPSPKYRRPV